MARISLNSNISSLTTQRRLGDATRELSSTFERLSSGLRINRAADDAAGLAIADNLKADNRVFAQGIRNLNDGLSLLNVADGALTELSNIVVRIRELAEQSANGTLSNKQREALDQEAQELSDEFTRIAQTTEYNGLKLFDGSLGELSLQAGFGVRGAVNSTLGGAIGDGTFEFSISYAIDAESIAAKDFNNDGFLDVAIVDSSDETLSVLIGNGDGSFTTTSSLYLGAGLAEIREADLNSDGNIDLVAYSPLFGTSLQILIGRGNGSFSLGESFSVTNSSDGVAFGDLNRDGTVDMVAIDGNSGAITYLGNGYASFQESGSFAIDTTGNNIELADMNNDGLLDLLALGANISIALGNGDGSFGSITSYSGVPSGSFAFETADLNGDGNIDVVAPGFGLSVWLGQGDGSLGNSVSYGHPIAFPTDISLSDINGDGILDITSVGSSNGLIFSLGKGDGSFQPYTTLHGANFSEFSLGDFNGDGVLDISGSNYSEGTVNILLGNTNPGVGPLLPFSLSTKADALQAMAPLDRKIEQLALQKGTIGAFQSRVEVAINNLQISSTNVKAAESRIRDVDVAFESARLTRLNILQQAGAAVLGQANIQPALALQLLSG